MKPIEHVVILLGPSVRGLRMDGSPGPTQREFYEYDRLATELQLLTHCHVEISESNLETAPSESQLLVAYNLGTRDSLAVAALCAGAKIRPIFIGVDYKEAFALSEPTQAAGIISSERFIRWILGQEDRVFRQIYGLKSLAASLAPVMRPTSAGETEHYCLYDSDKTLSLPEMLVLYLGSYWRSLP